MPKTKSDFQSRDLAFKLQSKFSTQDAKIVLS